MGLTLAPAYAGPPAGRESAAFLERFRGIVAACFAEREIPGALGVGIDDLARAGVEIALDLTLAASQSRPKLGLHLRAPPGRADAAAEPLKAFLSSAPAGPSRSASGFSGRAAAAFQAAGGRVFGGGGRLSGIALGPTDPLDAAAAFRALCPPGDGVEVAWRDVSAAAQAFGAPIPGFATGAAADFLTFDSDRLDLADKPGREALPAFREAGDPQALRAVYLGGEALEPMAARDARKLGRDVLYRLAAEQRSGVE